MEDALNLYKYYNIVLDVEKETVLLHKNHKTAAEEEYQFSHFLHYNNDRSEALKSYLFFPIRYYE
jgi:hypothetical protein